MIPRTLNLKRGGQCLFDIIPTPYCKNRAIFLINGYRQNVALYQNSKHFYKASCSLEPVCKDHTQILLSGYGLAQELVLFPLINDHSLRLFLYTGNKRAGMIAITVKPIDHQKAILYALVTVWIPDTLLLES